MLRALGIGRIACEKRIVHRVIHRKCGGGWHHPAMKYTWSLSAFPWTPCLYLACGAWTTVFVRQARSDGVCGRVLWLYRRQARTQEWPYPLDWQAADWRPTWRTSPMQWGPATSFPPEWAAYFSERGALGAVARSWSFPTLSRHRRGQRWRRPRRWRTDAAG